MITFSTQFIYQSTIYKLLQRTEHINKRPFDADLSQPNYMSDRTITGKSTRIEIINIFSRTNIELDDVSDSIDKAWSKIIELAIPRQ